MLRHPILDRSRRFINSMLDRTNSAEFTNLIGLGNPHRDTLQYIKPEVAQYFQVARS